MIKSTKYTRKVFNNYKEAIINKRNNVFMIILIISFLILTVKLYILQVLNSDKYKSELEKISINIKEGSTAPRGKIFDRNGKLLVDNKPTKTIYYKKNNVTTKEEIEIAYKLANILDIEEKISDNNLKKFWIKLHKEESDLKITEKEWNEYKFRNLSANDIEKLKLERINDEINEFSIQDKKAAIIYTLMNKGYSNSEKIIKNKNVTDNEYATIALANIKGVDVRLDWERDYLYGDTLKSLFGSVSSSSGLPLELKDYYLQKGYNLDDRVGSSYLEYVYDDYLKGKKDIYEINIKGVENLKEEGSKGNDLYLTIDIDLQLGIEKILEEEILKAKSEPYTDFYNRSFVIVSDPNTGEILAISGKQIVFDNNSYKFYDYTTGILTSPVTVGSVIKGASHATGYLYGGLSINENRIDNCVKIASTPIKCSWKYLGTLNDISSLKYSSNTYQFYTAIKVMGLKYLYNMALPLDADAFKKYRTTFNMFGLGVKTGIDLPNESVGQIGKNDTGGLLLDFSIGQYDTYTPLQLNQYIGSIATSYRIKPHLLKYVKNKDKLIYEEKTTILNTIDIDYIYLDRIRQGLKSVLDYGGTGSGYINRIYNPAGKTGTSQSFIDTNLDGKIDTQTITNTFVGYAPYDNPKVTFTVVSPDVSYPNERDYQTYVNRRIANRVSELYFTMYN